MKNKDLILLCSTLICKNEILEEYQEEKKDFIYMYKNFFVNINDNKLKEIEIKESFFKDIKKGEFQNYLTSIKKLKNTIKKIRKEIEPSYINKKNVITMTLMSFAMMILPVFFCFFNFAKKDKKVSTRKLLKLQKEFKENFDEFLKEKENLYNQIYSYIQNDQNTSLKEKRKFIKLIETIKEKNQIKNLNNINLKLNEKIAKNKEKEL